MRIGRVTIRACEPAVVVLFGRWQKRLGQGLTMPVKRSRCSRQAGCGSECLTPQTAAPLVVVACTLALFVPFLDSMGVKLNSILSWGPQFTYLSVFIVIAWLGAIVIGCLRKHEDIFTCFIDSFGIPGIITAGILAKNLAT